MDKKICPMCFEEQVGENTEGLCVGCYKANEEDDREALDVSEMTDS